MNTVLLAFSLGGVIKAGAIVGGAGLIIGILLVIAAKFFAVETDERIDRVRECLPGSNCGGCGYAGCDALAEAIVAGKAEPNTCPGSNVSGIAEVMGIQVEAKEKRTAFVKCRGTCEKTQIKYHYQGVADCRKLALIPGHGEKECIDGCMGYGSCVRACKFDAIHVINGVAVVDEEKCVACSACTKVCPNGLIEIIPKTAVYKVGCSSKKKGREVKNACSTGCIACGICVKQCEAEAISIVNNAAVIDYTKCTACGKCAEKCPQKIITK